MTLTSLLEIRRNVQADIVTVDVTPELVSVWVIRRFAGKAWLGTFTTAEAEHMTDQALLVEFWQRAKQHEY